MKPSVSLEPKYQITELFIAPVKGRLESGPSGKLAGVRAVLNGDLLIKAKICEGADGLYVGFPGLGFVGADGPKIRRELSNRILATWVINYGTAGVTL